MPYAWRLWRLLRASKSAGVVESLCRSVSVPHNFCPAGRQGFPERPSQIPCLPLFRYHLADAPLGAKANLAGVDLKLLVLRLPRIGSKRLDVVVTPAAFAIKNRMANVERRNLIECQIETLQGAAAIFQVLLCCFSRTDVETESRAHPRCPLEGHTDHQPYRDAQGKLSSLGNDRLSTERALAVFEELWQSRTGLDVLRNTDQLALLGFSGYGDVGPWPMLKGRPKPTTNATGG
jgi:hypothetical protein